MRRTHQALTRRMRSGDGGAARRHALICSREGAARGTRGDLGLASRETAGAPRAKQSARRAEERSIHGLMF